METSPEKWAGTAAAVDGLNVNWAPGKQREDRLGRTERKAVIERFAKAKEHAYQVVPHGTDRKTEDNDWETAFSRADAYGYKLEYLYTYSAGPKEKLEAR